jgi:hypothetical protein
MGEIKVHVELENFGDRYMHRNSRASIVGSLDWPGGNRRIGLDLGLSEPKLISAA